MVTHKLFTISKAIERKIFIPSAHEVKKTENNENRSSNPKQLWNYALNMLMLSNILHKHNLQFISVMPKIFQSFASE